MEQIDAVKLIAKALDDKKGEDIKVIKVGDLTILADYFVIAQGGSNTQVRALADEVEFRLSEKGIHILRRESDTGDTWIILDYGDILVHVFRKDIREHYGLDKVWADGTQIEIEF